MKKLFLILLTTINLSLFAQNNGGFNAVYSDPAISNLQFRDMSDAPVNTDVLTVGDPLKLQFTISNNDGLNAIPRGTCQVVITLGAMFRPVIDPSNMPNPPFGDYFHWHLEQAPGGGQIMLVGDLYKNLPGRFSGTVEFSLMPFEVGLSTMTCQLLITNDNNPTTVLSDIAPSNNYVSRSYTITKPFGIKFTRFEGMSRGCTIDMNWSVYDEDKTANKFIIETSADGINFQAVKTISSGGNSAFNWLLEGLSKSALYLRIKAVSVTGQFLYSGILFISDICTNRMELTLYPNPVDIHVNDVSIIAKKGIFDGKYSFRLTDGAGNEVKQMQVTLKNQLQVTFNTGFISSGSYYITVTGEDGKTISLKLLKQ